MFRKESLEIPSEFICPITRQIMEDPVQLEMHFSSYPNSHCVYETFTYERSAIEEYINKSKEEHDRECANDDWDSLSNFELISPVTGKTLVYQRADAELPALISDRDLKIRIQEYKRLLPIIEKLCQENSRLEKENTELKKGSARKADDSLIPSSIDSVVSLMAHTGSPITSGKGPSAAKQMDESCVDKPVCRS